MNRLLRDVNRAIVGEDDRDRIEAAVCRKLVGTDLYAAAFVSRSDRNGGVTVTNAAGLSTETAQGLVESHRLPFDQSILGAYRTNSPTVFAPRGTTESDESAATRLSSLGVRSVGNFPVASEDAVFGVVTLLATDDDAFPVRERTVLTELADIVGKRSTMHRRRSSSTPRRSWNSCSRPPAARPSSCDSASLSTRRYDSRESCRGPRRDTCYTSPSMANRRLTWLVPSRTSPSSSRRVSSTRRPHGSN
ncbi:GAF domain-containing protein [Haloarculaceae archaeon H-GB11]|nr:GAF domain-containing protein [Haloarculaceae archaeon H-GB11]